MMVTNNIILCWLWNFMGGVRGANSDGHQMQKLWLSRCLIAILNPHQRHAWEGAGAIFSYSPLRHVWCNWPLQCCTCRRGVVNRKLVFTVHTEIWTNLRWLHKASDHSKNLSSQRLLGEHHLEHVQIRIMSKLRTGQKAVKAAAANHWK